MRKISFITLILLLAAAALSACGGGGGESADPNAPAAIAVTASKNMALANGSDVVTLQAAVTKADGTAVPDGTVVTFAVTNATLSAASAATTSGNASVTMTCGAIAGANNYTATVTAAAGGASGTRDVKFINQPSSVDVSIAFNPAVSNLAALDFTLNNTVGASFDNNAQLIIPVNAAEGSFVMGNFVSNSTRINFINAAGFNTGTTPIIKATFAVASDAGMPQFSVSSSATITATDTGGNPITPAVTAAGMAVTVTFNTEL